MKKILSVTVIVVMLLALVGCGGSDSKYVGMWKLTGANYAGVEMTAEQMGMEAVMDVKSNGKITIELNGDKNSGKWKEKDGKLIISDSTEQELEAEMKDKKLVLEYSGAEMIFEK